MTLQTLLNFIDRKSIRRYLNQLTTACVVTVLISGTSLATEPSKDALDLYNKAIERNKTGKLVAASILLTEALTTEPEFERAYYQRGLSFWGMDQQQAAILDFTKAINFGIKNLEPYRRLIAWHKQHKEYDQALIVIDRLVSNMPENATGAYWDKGHIHELQGNDELALESYRKVLLGLDSEDNEFAKTVRLKITSLQQSDTSEGF